MGFKTNPHSLGWKWMDMEYVEVLHVQHKILLSYFPVVRIRRTFYACACSSTNIVIVHQHWISALKQKMMGI